MADKLIIVESPAKANTIKKFLGGNTKVVASMGHIRDLPKSKLGINIENNFEPEYINIRGKGDLIKELKTGKNIGLVSDAGTPGICDPGEEIIKKCIEESIKVALELNKINDALKKGERD